MTTVELIIMLVIAATITIGACAISAENLVNIDNGYRAKMVEIYGGSD